VEKSYKSLIGIETQNNNGQVCLNLTYFRFDKVSPDEKMTSSTSSAPIPIATAIKSFLQNGGQIMQIIDLDANDNQYFHGKIEKYLVILMEVGLVVLLIKYEYNANKAPTISLLKHMPKLCADCICVNLYPLEKSGPPCFWMAKDNWIQLVEIDPKKGQKIVPFKSQKYEFE